jgi:NAD-dependent dihydropyrimidine dehydrogenase PreA subunit
MNGPGFPAVKEKVISMKVTRKIIEIDEERCDGCGNCVISCAEGALKIIDGKAKVISDNLCDGLGACIGDCPQDALKIIEREAEDFDEAAVEAHLEAQEENKDHALRLPVHTDSKLCAGCRLPGCQYAPNF